MPTERIAMRRVREMLRLSRDAGLATREVARRTGVAPSTLREMFRRFETSGLTWPLPLDLADADLEARLYGEAGTKQGHRRRAEPDWAALNRELKRKHVTLQILWDEYIEANPGGYRYSRFCELYRSWEARLPVTMRQTHLGGDKLFVDYAGDTVPVIVDRRSGRVRRAHIFVAVMGGSSLSFAHASWTETLPDWIDAHAQAFTYFGGAARLLVPDNPKVAVIKACFYDPQVNRTYAEMAAHYDTAVLPACPRRPRDKATLRSISCTALACKAWPRPSTTLPTMTRPQASATPTGWPCCWNERLSIVRTSVSARACATPGYAITPSLRTSTTAPTKGSIGDCWPISSRATGSITTTTWWSPGRPASARAGWPARSDIRPAATTAPSSYVRVPKLFDELALAHGDGSAGRRLRALGAAQLLILDDWGLEPLGAQARHDLLEILEDRYGRRSTIVTSQLPIPDWHAVIGEATYADAILDRLVHNAHRLELSGESLRRSAPPSQA